MSVKVTLFGELQVLVSDQPVSLATKPTESLFAFLVAHGGKRMSRIATAETVWPDVELEKATNRLRTSLVHVRKVLLPWSPITADRQNVTLDIADAEVDLFEAERLYRRSRIAQDPDEEREILQRFLTLVKADLLPDPQFAWAESLQIHWRERRIEAALRLGSIGIGFEDYELAESESLRAISIDEFNEEAWSLYIRAMTEMGRQKQAIARFGTVQERLLTELGFDFSKELLQLVHRISSGAPKSATDRSRFTTAARDAISNALERSNPDLLLPILTTDAFKKEALRSPNDAWKMICDVLERTEGTSDMRLQLIRLLIFLTDVVGQYGVALDYAEWLLDNTPEDNLNHWFALNNLGFMNFQLREWDLAWSYMKRYLDLVEKYDQAREIAIAKSQMASISWHQGNLDSALSEYRAQAEQLGKDQTISGMLNLCALSANIGTILTIQNQWREAKEHLGKSHSLAISNGFDYVKGSIMAPLGMSMIMTGQKEEGRKLAANGLAHTYRSRYRRMHQISADYAAGALAACGYVRQGIAVLDAYTEFREESRHERSIAELQLTDWIRQEFGSGSPKAASTDSLKPSEIVADSCDILESN